MWFFDLKLNLLSANKLPNCYVLARFCTGKSIKCNGWNDEDFEVLEVEFTDEETEETEEKDEW